jgi:uncharacterized membrane protein (UPF0136 family)
VRRLWIALLFGAAPLTSPAAAAALRPIPDTSAGVYVWQDQLPDGMTDAQVRFEAQHVSGTQKVSRETATRLRSIDPNFLVLHYRLGIGDGPVPFRIGAHWASDYARVKHHASWFWRYHGRRVFQRQSHWYVMNPDTGWRAYWARRVLYEAALLGDDGVFADSLSVPQYLGASGFSPPLAYFDGEAAWTRRIDDFMRYEEDRLRGRLYFIPNAGSWITTRDQTDYSIPDGVMIEGFAEAGAHDFYAPDDWRLQINRVLGLAGLGRVVMAQSYLASADLAARGFVLASYLLTQGAHSFLNMDIGISAQWFPEYGLDLGHARDPLPADVAALRDTSGVYVRRFERGFVAVNPDASSHTLALDAPGRLIEPVGGGGLDAAADTSGWSLREHPISGSLALPAHSGAIVLTGS